MAKINSVLGPLDTADLGFTLMHEHIFVTPGGFLRDYPELLEPNPLEYAVKELKKVKEGGIDTIVDASTPDLGRDVNFLAEVSRQSGVNIITCAGWWMEIPRFLTGASADQMADVFAREVEKGISGTDIKAGILKAASDMQGVTPPEETILRAVSRAHKKTGAPIMIHSFSPLRVGEQQMAILKEEGVDLTRVKFDHSNDTLDLEYLFWILEQGCFLGMDRYPGHNVSTLARTKTMKELIDAGYADRLCPSHDWPILTVKTDPPSPMEADREKINPYGHLFVKKVVFPMLQEMGVAKEIVDGLCINSPRKFFEGG